MICLLNNFKIKFHSGLCSTQLCYFPFSTHTLGKIHFLLYFACFVFLCWSQGGRCGQWCGTSEGRRQKSRARRARCFGRPGTDKKVDDPFLFLDLVLASVESSCELLKSSSGCSAEVGVDFVWLSSVGHDFAWNVSEMGFCKFDLRL